MRLVIGLILAPPDQYPIQRAMAAADLAPGPNPPTVSPDEWMAHLGGLPLLYQPGERWLYHTAYDVLGVLIARASGQTFEAFLRERLFEPLGMTDTGFAVPADRRDRGDDHGDSRSNEPAVAECRDRSRSRRRLRKRVCGRRR